MSALSQKEFVSFLDNAASRAEMIDASPATGKQCWFLAKLICDADECGSYITNTSLVLTKSKASNLIELYLN